LTRVHSPEELLLNGVATSERHSLTLRFGTARQPFRPCGALRVIEWSKELLLRPSQVLDTMRSDVCATVSRCLLPSPPAFENDAKI